jgi:hypothetical protein
VKPDGDKRSAETRIRVSTCSLCGLPLISGCKPFGQWPHHMRQQLVRAVRKHGEEIPPR